MYVTQGLIYDVTADLRILMLSLIDHLLMPVRLTSTMEEEGETFRYMSVITVQSTGL